MSVITVQIDDNEKKDYHAICKENDTTMSQAIRKFIRSEIAKHKKRNK